MQTVRKKEGKTRNWEENRTESRNAQLSKMIRFLFQDWTLKSNLKFLENRCSRSFHGMKSASSLVPTIVQMKANRKRKVFFASIPLTTYSRWTKAY